ncbi:ferredoxin-A, partial [Haematococcus lacustris]
MLPRVNIMDSGIEVSIGLRASRLLPSTSGPTHLSSSLFAFVPERAHRIPEAAASISLRQAPEKETEAKASTGDRPQASAPRSMLVELGPIGLTFGTAVEENASSTAGSDQPPLTSIHSMTTAEWRAQYEKDGMVDLWVEEEFNAGSRLV